MSVSYKFERSLLSHEEHEVLRLTHHPAIYDHDLEGLKALRVRLRQLRDKERTLARQKQRERRGKSEPRGGSFPGTVEQPLHRKQVFAAALKRVNKELGRMHCEAGGPDGSCGGGSAGACLAPRGTIRAVSAGGRDR
jgi:hypothetical protein